MGENKRAHFRVKIPSEVNIYLTIGLTGAIKHPVLDISEGGIGFSSNSKLKIGESALVAIVFPKKGSPFQVTIRPIRCTELIDKKDEPEASEEEEIEEDSHEEPAKKQYIIAARFVALTMGQEDEIYGEIRKLERLNISVA